jgi:hypothetical protein
VSARLTNPFPVTSDVTSTAVHVAAKTRPDAAILVGDIAGAFANVVVVSPHVVSATA